MSSPKISKIANQLSALSIANINEKIKAQNSNGEKIFNLTIGDFDPKEFPIPAALEAEIIAAYNEKYTNYALVGGMAELRQSIAEFMRWQGEFHYDSDEIVVASGARPLIYIFYKTVLDAGDKVINFVPSWNNYNYIQLMDAAEITVATKAENNFLPTADELAPYLAEATLITLNSPLNPTGSTFSDANLQKIFDLVIAENQRRANKKKPLYVMIDIVYRLLPIDSGKPQYAVYAPIRDYLILVDGISKCFAATGLRVGWACGPKEIISKMRQILGHVGAFAGKPEQIGTLRFLQNKIAVTTFLTKFRQELNQRISILYDGFLALEQKGYPISVIKPTGGIYLALKIDLLGAITKNGDVLKTSADIFHYFLTSAKIAMVPFYVFGYPQNEPWFRVAVGSSTVPDLHETMRRFNIVFAELSFRK